MNSIPEEFRLAMVLLLNAGVLAGAWRFVRRWVEDWNDAAADTLLLWYLVQYVVVAGLGVCGGLSGTGIIAGGMGCAIALFAAGGRGGRGRRLNEEGSGGGEFDRQHGGRPLWLNEDKIGERVVVAAAVAVASYLGAIVWMTRLTPAIANDALAYHLPAAVQWLQTGRLGLFHTWFYNPANSYSPLAGSTYIAWLMGPMGNDSLARFVETPAVMLLFFGVVQLSRAFGASLAVAAVLATGTVVARPVISQAVLAKDDVPLVAVFVASVSALTRKRLVDQLGPWRVGAAVGLFFATKYTAMLNAPVLLLAIDAPWRAGWRWGRHFIAIATIALLAGPWFVRNWILTGNPIYPTGVSFLGMHLFRGGLQMLHSTRLTSWRGAWQTITGSYYSPGPPLAIGGILLWVAAMAVVGKQLKTSPLKRACLIGPAVVIALFVLHSPYGEVRLITPAFALFFPMIALLPWSWVGGTVMAGLAYFAGFEPNRLHDLWTANGVILAIFLATWMCWRLSSKAMRGGLIAVILIALGGWIYVGWKSYRGMCEQVAAGFWEDPSVYGSYASAWSLIRERTPPGSTIAYDNFFMVYPLFGPDLSRHVVYVPSRPGVHEVNDLPFMGPIIGEQVPVEVVRVMNEHADAATWMHNLAASGAHYLLVGKQDLTMPQLRVHPPELDFIAAAPTHFRTLLSNDAVDVYAVLP